MAAFPPALAHLAPLPIWMLWQALEPKAPGGKWRKRPMTPNGTLCGFTDDACWRPYGALVQPLGWGFGSGVGICASAVRAAGADVLMLDIDDCVRDGVASPEAMAIVDACGSYAELSPSGTGIRVIGGAAGWDPAAGNKANWQTAESKGEVYFSTGWCTVTFQWLAGREGQWADIGSVCMSLPRVGRAGRDGGGTNSGPRTPNPDMEAPADIVAETLALVPNAEVGWERWNTIGMAVWAATKGSDEGLGMWDAWSARCEEYGARDTCEERWTHWCRSSPPTRIGFGTLWWEAQQAEQAAGREWSGGRAWLAWKTTAGLSALPIHGTAGAGAGGSAGAAAVAGGNGGGATTGGGVPDHPLIVRGDDGRPVVVLAGALHERVDAAELALIASGLPAMHRAGHLVRPVEQSMPAGRKRRTMATSLKPLCQADLLHMLSRAAGWQKWDGRSKSMKRCDPPVDIAATLLSMAGLWRLPQVAGVATTPTLRTDGSVLARVGYDTESRLWCAFGDDLIAAGCEAWADERPVKADAEAGIALLDGLLDEAPFVTAGDRSVALSLILTLVARGALDAAPLHAFRASAAGSGKSYLVDIASAVATGRICPTVAAGPKEEEQEKRLSGILQAGLSLASIDNLNGDLKGELLCQIVERPYVRVRPLGENLTIEVENSMVLCATGNQMRIVGDMNRRTVTCDLDAGMERPETRSFARDPVGEVMTGRARYVHAALTVVRAHLLAGCPGWDKGREELQSFGDWSRLVRGALVWLGKADPIETTRRSRDEDPDFVGLRTLLAAWRARFGLNHATGHTLREAIEAASTGAVMQAIRREEGVPLESTAGFAASNTSAVSAEHAAGEAAANLREALLAVAGVRGVMDLRGVGKWMSMHEKRIAGGLRFVRTDKDRNDVQRWKVSAVRPALMIVS